MRDFRSIKVWEKSHQLTLAIYAVTRQFPNEERFSLTDQMRRSSSSIPTNIAEGCGRDGDAELRRFMQISMGSASELEYQLLLAQDLGYLPSGDYQNLMDRTTEVKRMLSSFIKRLRK
ncbi:MAG: four helix bundle protein [Chloroflexota bacterium]